MKKIILSLICFTAFACNNINAQCTPNLSGPSGQISPDTIQNLPRSYVGFPYGTDIQLYVAHDTMSLPITDFTIDSVVGLPSGFTYVCNPNNCIFPGASADCIHLSGAAPTIGMIGTYPIIVYVTAHVSIITQHGTKTGYKIDIDSASWAGTQNISNPAKFEVFQNNPNPFNGNTVIDYASPYSGRVDFKVYDMLGQMISNKIVYSKYGMNQITVNSKDLAPGIYMYSLSNGAQTITKRMVVGNK